MQRVLLLADDAVVLPPFFSPSSSSCWSSYPSSSSCCSSPPLFLLRHSIFIILIIAKYNIFFAPNYLTCPVFYPSAESRYKLGRPTDSSRAQTNKAIPTQCCIWPQESRRFHASASSDACRKKPRRAPNAMLRLIKGIFFPREITEGVGGGGSS